MPAAPQAAAPQCETMAELLPQLPRIMRSRGWLRGAALMEEWFRRPANNDPERGVPNTHTIKMSWVLSYPRAAQVYSDEIMSQKIWINPAAQRTIIQQLRRNNQLFAHVGSEREFGDVGEYACFSPHQMLKIEYEHIQSRAVQQSPLSAPLDDLTAALANFFFHVVIKGKVRCIGRPQASALAQYEATITRVGVYVKDSYDFNDDDKDWMSQPLGFWGCEDDYAGKNPFAGRYVNNKSFRDWRDKHGRGHGGDFYVFSDILVTQTNDSFRFEA